MREKCDHSEPSPAITAIVFTVDLKGNTTSVVAKMGEGPISINHPTAPDYYSNQNGVPTHRAYFRKTVVNDNSLFPDVLKNLFPIIPNNKR